MVSFFLNFSFFSNWMFFRFNIRTDVVHFSGRDRPTGLCDSEYRRQNGWTGLQCQLRVTGLGKWYIRGVIHDT